MPKGTILLKESQKLVQQFVRHYLQCKMTDLQMQNYAQLHLEVLQMSVVFILMDLIGPFEITSRGNQYALTMICRLISYIMHVSLVDKARNTVVNAYLKEIYYDFGGSHETYLPIKVSLKTLYMLK